MIKIKLIINLILIILINALFATHSFSYNVEEKKDDFFYNIFISSQFKTIHITVRNEKQFTVDFLILIKDGKHYKRKMLTIPPNNTEYFQFADIENSKINLNFFYIPKYDRINFIKVVEMSFNI